MKLDEILQQFPDNAALRQHAEQLNHEALLRWIDRRPESATDHVREIDCIRTDIVLFACQLRTKLAEFKTIDQPVAPEIEPAVLRLIQLGEEHVAIELRGLQVYLDLLDAAAAIVVDSGTSRALANAWVSHVNRLIDETRCGAHVEEGLCTTRKLIDGLLTLR